MEISTLSAFFLMLSVSIYVLLDGFDLGVGALLLFEQDGLRRNHMVDAIVPTWDGNETWLIMAGIEMFAGFPIAYSVLLPALYVPLTVMLLSLGLRGVSFEFRYQAARARPLWDAVFAIGSILAAFSQGVFVGGLILGVDVEKLAFVGGPLDWLSPFSILFGFTSLTGFALLGAGWLYFKGEEKTQTFAKSSLRWVAPVFLLFSATTCVAASQIQPQIHLLWSHHIVLGSVLSSLFILIGVFVTFRAHFAGSYFDVEPFACALMMFTCALIGLAFTFAPNIVPFRVSIWAASSPPSTQVFLLTGALVIVPVIIGYSAFSYWVFRGKTPKEGWGE